jgi:hypothetical protein
VPRSDLHTGRWTGCRRAPCDKLGRGLVIWHRMRAQPQLCDIPSSAFRIWHGMQVPRTEISPAMPPPCRRLAHRSRCLTDPRKGQERRFLDHLWCESVPTGWFVLDILEYTRVLYCQRAGGRRGFSAKNGCGVRPCLGRSASHRRHCGGSGACRHRGGSGARRERADIPAWL